MIVDKKSLLKIRYKGVIVTKGTPMMKFVLSFLLFSTSVLANRDSVAFFYTTKKVNVLLNEKKVNSRISQFMDAVGAHDAVLLVSKDGDVRLGCAREEDRGTCTFTFYPSSTVLIENKELKVEKEVGDFNLPANLEFEMRFKGSMKDELNLSISNGRILIFAAKK